MDVVVCAAKGINTDDGIEYDYSWTGFYDLADNEGIIMRLRSNREAFQADSTIFDPWSDYYQCSIAHQMDAELDIC